jgi:dienelactone hydrolase
MAKFNNPDPRIAGSDRRDFIKTSVSLLAFYLSLPTHSLSGMNAENMIMKKEINAGKSIIGAYGAWAASLLKPVAQLSFRNPAWKDLASWKKQAVAKVKECVASPEAHDKVPKVTVDKKYIYDGLEIEEISWQLPYGNKTRAVVLKPAGINKPLPAILGLHDHAGKKYFGYRKIVRTGEEQHPMISAHQASDYGGIAWANEIAKRGYVVLVHDTIAFGSRRVLYDEVRGLDYGDVDVKNKSDEDPEKDENIESYNRWSGAHEHVMSKSLFCAGTTWPGVFLSEDQIALDILAARKDVISEKIGCGGLSGGGLRTVYLAGLDPRIKCAVCVGFMTTWKDLVLTKSFTHTWMTYAPLLPNYMDFPEILGLRVPLPTLVQNNNQDELFTLDEMKQCDRILKDVFSKAGAGEKYAAKFYDGPHKFDGKMQSDAFDWFDSWLK